MPHPPEHLLAAATVATDALGTLAAQLGIGYAFRPWNACSKSQRDGLIADATIIADTPDFDAEQYHARIVASLAAFGWRYGPIFDPDRYEMPEMAPWAEAPFECRLAAHLFVNTVRSTLHALLLATQTKPERN